MLLSTFIRSDSNRNRRVAIWLVVALSLVGLSAVPANAEMSRPIALEQPIHSFLWLDSPYLAVDSMFGSVFVDLSGGRSSTSKCATTETQRPEVPLDLPSIPFDPAPSEMPLFGLGNLTSSSGRGTRMEFSGRGVGSSAQAVVCRFAVLAPLTMVGWLNAIDVLNIPFAPPFELLRPPQFLTVLA